MSAYRYMSLRQPRAWVADEDLEAYSRQSCDVIVPTDAAPDDTGLVEANGTPIMRVLARHPVGFCR